MNYCRQLVFCLMVCTLFLGEVSGQTNAAATPPIPKLVSPVTQFRELLAMTGREVAAELSDRSEESREKILAKIREYQTMPIDVRESRLQATHLQFLLLPLMEMQPDQREGLLKSIPDEDLPLVRNRLTEWDKLSDEVRQTALRQPETLRWFFRADDFPGSEDTSAINPYFALRSKTSTGRQDLTRISKISDRDMAQQLNLLDPRRYSNLSRVRTILDEIQEMPDEQRERCMNSLATLSAMTPEQRSRLSINVTRWREMSPDAKKTFATILPDIRQIMPPGLE